MSGENDYMLPMPEIVANLKAHLNESNDGFLFKDMSLRDIPIEHRVLLCQYLSSKFVSAMYGGSYQYILQSVWKAIKEGATESNKEKEVGENTTPRYPAGIGDYMYAARLSVSMLKELEKLVLAGSSNQVVQAAKALLGETDKINKVALDTMQAYEKQLITLSEHIVEKFLPSFGKNVRKDFKEASDEIMLEVKQKLEEAEKFGDLATSDAAFKIWEEGINKFNRHLSMKRFELLFAKSLSEDLEIKQAFDFTEDLLESYVEDKRVGVKNDDASVKVIREAQAKRKAKK